MTLNMSSDTYSDQITVQYYQIIALKERITELENKLNEKCSTCGNVVHSDHDVTNEQ